MKLSRTKDRGRLGRQQAGRLRSMASPLAAKLGLVAVLFQAILFGWHHHELSFPGNLPAPVVENPAGPPQLADDEDHCDICQVLHHLTAAAPDTVAAEPRPPFHIGSSPDDRDFVVRALTLCFHARAPPLA